MGIVKVGLIVLVISNCVLAATIRVPQDQPTIQAGINVAVDGDTVLVGPGVYYQRLWISGKRVSLIAENEDDSTIIQAQDSIIVLNNVPGGVVVDGFRLRSIGWPHIDHAHYGIVLSNSSAVYVSDCIFGDNLDIGIQSEFSSSVITGCTFLPHEIVHPYISIEKQSVSAVRRNVFIRGEAQPALYVADSATSCIVENNTFVGNLGAISSQFRASTTAQNNIFFGLGSYAVHCSNDSPLAADYSCFYLNFRNTYGSAQIGVENTFLDPMFKNTTSDDFELQPSSPCIDGGNPGEEFIDPDGTRNDIGAFCFDQDPWAVNIRVGEGAMNNVVDHMPTISWAPFSPDSAPQYGYEIEIGIDHEWDLAEMWQTGQTLSSDSAVVYAGNPLLDGITYFGRIRLLGESMWAAWRSFSYRMNSISTVPQPRLPTNYSVVSSQYTYLTVRSPIDVEGDSLLLTFEIAGDSLFSSLVPFTAQPSTDSLTMVNIPFYLTEDQPYWWRVKASDYYEESNYSPIWSFWINSENSAPTHFDLIAPANSFEPALTNTTPLLEWTQSNDIDPFDQVSYALHLAIDSSFSFASITSGIDGTSWQPSEPLNWGTKYWWKVKATDLSTGVTWSNQVYRFRIMRPGDPDGNGQISISDAVFLINYIFAGGPAPVPLLSGDADCSGAISISDAVYLINYIFGGGPEPCEP